MQSKFYKIFYNLVFPYFPNHHLFQYLKWKLAIIFIGDEFHRVNLDKNRRKLAKHFSKDTPLQYELINLVNHSTAQTIRVLDVGAGPVSKVGKHINGKPIDLVPIDPMANKYKSILDSLGLKPPVWTMPGFGEKLSKKFPPNSFDIAHARNSIDHCLNPLQVIIETLSVLKPGCCFYLNHYLNEGQIAKYYGLHQWNFSIKNECFIITSKYRDEIDVNQEIDAIATVTEMNIVGNRIIIVLKKRLSYIDNPPIQC